MLKKEKKSKLTLEHNLLRSKLLWLLTVHTLKVTLGFGTES